MVRSVDEADQGREQANEDREPDKWERDGGCAEHLHRFTSSGRSSVTNRPGAIRGINAPDCVISRIGGPMTLCYLRAMSFVRRELPALLIVVGAGIAGAIVWNHGGVDLGLRLASHDGLVVVDDVTPDGNAARNQLWPGMYVIDMTTLGGVQIERGDPIPLEGGFDGQGSNTIRPPIDPIDSAWISTIEAGYADDIGGPFWLGAYIQRGWLEYQVDQSILFMIFGLALGAVVWRALLHGIAGPLGREHAAILGAAVATPFLLLPAVLAGTPIGIAAGYLVPAGVALILGVSLARSHPDRSWVQTGIAGSVLAAAMAVVFVVRYLSSSTLAGGDRPQIFLLIAAIALVPATVAALAPQRSSRERAVLVSLGLVPIAALMLISSSYPQPWWPPFLLLGLFGWQVLPMRAVAAAVGNTLDQVRSQQSTASVPDRPDLATSRDRLVYVVLAGATVIGILSGTTWTLLWGIGLAALVGFAVRRGFLGPAWTDAAVPLAASVAVPVILYPFMAEYYSYPLAMIPTALAALSVAHVLATRHTDPVWQSRLFTAACLLTVLIMLFSIMGIPALGVPLIGAVALIPGFPTAFAVGPGEPPAVSARLETLAIALTPGAAATILVTDTNGIILGAWLIALVVWRQFTLNPLVGMAQRTQLQRDVAVAAAETERARLAADLHDDALQQLTMLVRTLDEAGQAEAAAEARDVATKLRAVVGDLRLPILDDLGAGAALEWLVERMEPLAGGPVRLERSDATRPPANVELAVFRVAQEAIANAIRHGNPPIEIHYDVRTDGRVTLAIDDAGAGIGEKAAEEAPQQGHFGLLNMQQRAEQIGALLDVRRWPAGGTRVALEWRPQ